VGVGPGGAELYVRRSCSALLIICSDFRFQTAERAFAETAGLADDYDLIARPGAVRSLVAPRDDAARDTMIDEIRLLHRLHGFTRVLLVNHMSCRAYDDLVGPADERERHVAHLAAARGVVEGLVDAKAETYLAASVDGLLSVTPIDSRGG
jgi:hypothetical protein